MRVSHDVKTISSFLLFLDHVVQSHGEAFVNYSGALYSIVSPYYGLYAYATPFKQLCNDSSIAGATIMTGVYINNVYVNVGTSGLKYINHTEGVVYFTGALPTNTSVSGRYAFKEFNTQITDQWDMKLLFETKYVSNTKYNQALSGLPADTKTAPAIFLRFKAGENKPFSFGGLDDNSLKIRAVIIADNEFQKIGICNIFKNLNLSGFGIVNSTPFDYRGNYTGNDYNYNNLSISSTYQPFVRECRSYEIPQLGQYSDVARSMAIVDFEIFTAMKHNI